MSLISSSEPLRFVHISDTHFGPTRDFELYGIVSYVNAERIIAAINALPFTPDFVFHTGDVTSFPDTEAYKLAARVFSQLKVPMFFATGNHDLARKIRAHLPMGEAVFSSIDENVLSYAFELKGYRFITLDARGPDAIDPHGVLSLHQCDFLKNQIEQDTLPFAVFIHFPALRLDSHWFDELMLLLNGDILHQILIPKKDRVRGVFFGHVHRGMKILKDGILYASVASTGGQFSAYPGDASAQLDVHHPPCFNIVTFMNGQTIIKEHSIAKS